MAGSTGWCLIESDPGVFTELTSLVGVKGIVFREIYGLDNQAFESIQYNPLDIDGSISKVYGFVFLFNWSERPNHHIEPINDAEQVFFAKQTVENACASQALVSILFNCKDHINLGGPLTNLYDFSKDLDPYMRGEAIGNCEELRQAHNSFKTDSHFDIIQEKEEKSKDAFHYVAYVYCNGGVYELDGLKSGPTLIQKTPEEGWIDIVRNEIEKNVQEMQQSSNEIRFNLLAVVADPLHGAYEWMQQIKAEGEAIDALLDGKKVETAFDLPSDPESLQCLKQKNMTNQHLIQERILQEEETRKIWAKENARRRHDFVPFVLSMLKNLARHGQLVPAIESAKASSSAKRQRKF